MKAIVLLEDGFVLQGEGFGASGETVGEVVFNTAMSGYQEILTDPSYKGQIVCMTYPLIGNYGVNKEDSESSKIHLAGFIIKELSRIASNWRSLGPLEDYLKENNIVGIEQIDTRALVRHVRTEGSMKGIISTFDFNQDSLKNKMAAVPDIMSRDLASQAGCLQAYEWKQGLGLRRMEVIAQTPWIVVVIDCGVKFSILRNLKQRCRKVIVVPAHSTAKEILRLKPDGILFSNGPGDPQAVTSVIQTARELIDALRNREIKVAIMGVCLGHQILSIALGGKAEKLKFGHHGGNHPVKELMTGRIDITAQNHNFIIPSESIPDKDVILTHINLYDNTPEGQRHKTLPLFSVQFHPESGPGPFDARHIWGDFFKLMER